jgi:CHASE3 domain sensor protein
MAHARSTVYDGRVDSFDRKHLAALGIALLGLVTLAAAGWQSVSHLREDSQLVRRTRDTQAQIGDVYHTLLELETSQRGYLLTTHAPYLTRYRSGKGRLDGQLD